MSQHCDDEYASAKTQPLFPGNVRAIRNFLLSENSIAHLMLWTITLIGVSQCLRVEEVLTLTIENFLNDYHITQMNSVDSLLMWILGKSDKEKVHLNCWDRHHCSEFSAVCCLLLWIRIAKIKSGYIFPQLSNLNFTNNGTNDDADECYAYKNCLNDIKYLCYKILKLTDSEEELRGKFFFHYLGNIMSHF